ncbi:GDSL esterase/lipase [Glycine soja]|nr:GDSL esterase/lipase [Glycine soja]
MHAKVHHCLEQFLGHLCLWGLHGGPRQQEGTTSPMVATFPLTWQLGVTVSDMVTGVSFASGGSGLDPNTVALARVLDLSSQLASFEQALQRITRVVGNQKANDILENALFVISIGTNDMLYNAYLMPATSRMIRYGSISGYQDYLLQNLNDFVQTLYGAGARRILVAGLPPIGCLPVQVTLSSIKDLHWLQRLLEMGPVCNALDLTCPDPSKYLFWDAVHLTEAGNYVLAENGQQNVIPYLSN